MNAKETLTTWLEAGDTKRVLEGLSMLSKKSGDQDLSSNISFQLGRYHDLQTHQAKGVISHAEYQLESAKIRASLIAFIGILPDHWTSEALDLTTQIHAISLRRNWKKWKVIVAGVSVCTLIVILFSGGNLQSFFSKPVKSAMPVDTQNVNRQPAIKQNSNGDGSHNIVTQGDVIIGNSEINWDKNVAKKAKVKVDSLQK